MRIRPLAEADASKLAPMLADPEVMRFSVGGVLAEAQTRAFVRWCIGLYRERGYGPWALVNKACGALVGFCGLSPETVAGAEEVHVGYRLSRRFWNQGLATEAVREVLAHGFERLALPTIAAIVEPEHVASVRVLEKAGFRSFECKLFHGRQVRVYRQRPHS